MEFFLNVSLNSVTKIFVITVKELEPATRPRLVRKTRMLPQHQQDTCRDRIFKLSPIHGSVIFRFPEFTEFGESSALFRKNFNDSFSLGHMYCTFKTLSRLKVSQQMRQCLMSRVGWRWSQGSPCLIFGSASGWGWNWGPWGLLQ